MQKNKEMIILINVQKVVCMFWYICIKQMDILGHLRV